MKVVNTEKKLRRTGISGIVLGFLACLLCKLPLLLAFIGLGSLGGAIATLPFAQLESIGLVLALTGTVLLIVLGLRSHIRQTKREELRS